MANPSAKHLTFVGKSMRGIGVEELPGIGERSRERLLRENITQVQQLLGQCLVLEMDKRRCKQYFQTFGMNDKQQNDAYNALRDWADQHL